MSLARKCDRCGKFYETYAGADANDFGFNRVRLIEVGDSGHSWVRENFDLCKECSTNLEDWLKLDAHIKIPLILGCPFN